jgi:anti-sigma B factor antagonist
MMNFAIALETYGDVALLELVGEFDMIAEPTFAKVVGDQLARGARYIIVDLDKLSYIDSRGIYALLEMLRTVHDQDAGTALVLTNARISRIFALSGIGSVFRFFQNRTTALASAWDWRAPARRPGAVLG